MGADSRPGAASPSSGISSKEGRVHIPDFRANCWSPFSPRAAVWPRGDPCLPAVAVKGTALRAPHIRPPSPCPGGAAKDEPPLGTENSHGGPGPTQRPRGTQDGLSQSWTGRLAGAGLAEPGGVLGGPQPRRGSLPPAPPGPSAAQRPPDVPPVPVTPPLTAFSVQQHQGHSPRDSPLASADTGNEQREGQAGAGLREPSACVQTSSGRMPSGMATPPPPHPTRLMPTTPGTSREHRVHNPRGARATELTAGTAGPWLCPDHRALWSCCQGNRCSRAWARGGALPGLRPSCCQDRWAGGPSGWHSILLPAIPHAT